MRVVFLGTPQFAVPSLEALVRSGHEVLAVYTQPDRPKGRGNELAASPVKQAADKLGLPVEQPERIRRPEPVEKLRNLGAELMVVVGYGQIVPQVIIDMPAHGIVNVHASLLPRYRGAAPIQWAIAQGERETGVTIMQIDAGLDTGDMLLKASTAIGPGETAPELGERLAVMGADLLIEALEQMAAGSIRREKQNNEEATLAPILRKEDGLVDWSRPATEIDCRLRGFTPWPGAYTNFRGQTLQLLRVVPLAENGLQPGEVRFENKTLRVGCGAGTSLELLEVQPAGKKRMAAEAFANGYRPKPGERLGESR